MFLICIALLVNNINYFNQEKNVDTNFIIIVDDEISIGTIVRTSFKIQMIDGSEEKKDFFYEPGLLRLSETDFNTINSDSIESIKILFAVYRQGAIEPDEYELDFDKRWFSERYAILKLYNLDIRKYKNIFYPLSDVNYTYEVYTPNPMSTVIRIRKRIK